MNKNDVIICLMTFMGIISSLALWEWVLIRYLYPPDSAVPAGETLTNPRQEEAVSRALEYVRAAMEAMDCGVTPDAVLTELEGAMTALGELSGRVVREDITNGIFARFCVGK